MKLSETLKEKIIKKIEEEKEEVLQKVAELKSQDPFSNPDRLIDNAASDTEASEESTHDRYEAMISNLDLRINDLDKALSDVSKKDVNLKRLTALVPGLKEVISLNS